MFVGLVIWMVGADRRRQTMEPGGTLPTEHLARAKQRAYSKRMGAGNLASERTPRALNRRCGTNPRRRAVWIQASSLAPGLLASARAPHPWVLDRREWPTRTAADMAPLHPFPLDGGPSGASPTAIGPRANPSEWVPTTGCGPPSAATRWPLKTTSARGLSGPRMAAEKYDIRAVGAVSEGI